MTNLQDFVRDTLVSIVNGVREAQRGLENTWRDTKEGGARSGSVNPAWESSARSDHPDWWGMPVHKEPLYRVTFDVAVTADESAKGAAGVRVLSVFGAKGDLESRQVSVSRIQFSVPVEWPREP